MNATLPESTAPSWRVAKNGIMTTFIRPSLQKAFTMCHQRSFGSTMHECSQLSRLTLSLLNSALPDGARAGPNREQSTEESHYEQQRRKIQRLDQLRNL